MAKNKYFQFKQFRIVQERSAMKVGTDGILLGAWTNVEGCEQILDIGTGTGLIALMLAQRTKANITGIEIEQEAAKEALFNVESSLWSKRIKIENFSIEDYAKMVDKKFDLIVSNPPFFEKSLHSPVASRNMARHTSSLSYSELIGTVSSLLEFKGRLSIILPYNSAKDFELLANQSELYLNKKCLVKPRETNEPNRVLMQFSYEKSKCELESLNIYNNSDVGYTAEFKQLTKEYYLKF